MMCGIIGSTIMSRDVILRIESCEGRGHASGTMQQIMFAKKLSTVTTKVKCAHLVPEPNSR
jgi:hypothetical protein